MQLTQILAQMGGLQAMARELGVNEQQAASGAEALLPALLGGFKKQAAGGAGAPAGLGGLGGLLGQLGAMGGGGLMDEVLSPQPTDVSRGNAVLGQIFGSKDVSRAVAQGAASRTGLDPSLLQRMLPMLAMLVSGWMARQAGGAGAAASPAAPAGGSGLGSLGGGLGGGLGGALGSLMAAASGAAASGASGSSVAGASAGGLAGLASLLDLDGNGNPLDDVLRMVAKSAR
jgi:hypothetical protein